MSASTRWKEGAAPIEGLAEAMSALGAERASDAERSRLEARLRAQLAAPTMSQHASSGAASWLGLGRSWPWISMLLLGVGALWLTQRAEPSAPQPTASVPVMPSPKVAQDVPAIALPEAESAIAPRAKKPALKRAAGAAAPSAEAELELLRKAQRALNDSASAALTLADEHARLYPKGFFIQEREMLRIEAELTLGKRRAALERAQAFSQRFPSSTYKARIDRLRKSHRALKYQEPPPTERTQ